MGSGGDGRGPRRPGGDIWIRFCVLAGMRQSLGVTAQPGRWRTLSLCEKEWLLGALEADCLCLLAWLPPEGLKFPIEELGV